MRILHYTLGYPPNRTGGLVKYALDLMKEQSAQGHDVISLYPGAFNPFIKTKIKRKSMKNNDILSFELVNSLPLPLFGGIKNPKDFMKSVSESIYVNFLRELNVEVVHVHTLMGIHKEFFLAAKKLGISIIYTSHDYFGLSPVPDFFYNGKSFDNENTIENWMKISQSAVPTYKLRVFQLNKYYLFRKMVKFIKKFNPNNDMIENINVSEFDYMSDKNQWNALRSYYKEIFSLITKFHFNSTVARDVFLDNLGNFNCDYEVISITNNSIKNRIIENNISYGESKIKIAYIGPDKEYKGFNDFIEFARVNKSKSYDFMTFGYDKTIELPNVIQYGRYNSNQLKDVYSKFDVLVVPSLWKETFGLITLEALSYGKKVFVRNCVGSKDLVDDYFIFKNINEVLDKLIDLNVSNKKIFKEKEILKTISDHAIEMIKLYKS